MPRLAKNKDFIDDDSLSDGVASLEDSDEDIRSPIKKRNVTKDATGKEREVESIYQKLSQLEHILVRPDSYIGSVEIQREQMWVFENDQMVQRKINFVPGLYKIFDEILVNAADNKQRDASMTSIRVDIDKEKNSISVWNNGAGIPVVIHQKHNIYVPSLIFGHLLTSSNYDDDARKVTGGRNGYGAKLCNIYSSEFVVECFDSQRKKKFKQVFKNNMYDHGEPQITSHSTKEDYTKITFKPDLKRFNLTELDDDIIALFKKRVYDVAGCNSSLKVFLNGTRIPIKSFNEYCKLFFKNAPDTPHLYTKINDRWEICISASKGQFEQVSFVNSICTTKGGTHVVHVADKIAKAIGAKIEKKNKAGAKLKTFQIKNHLFLFVNCLIENPAFDSQTKDTLTSKASNFGSKCDIPEEFMKKVMKMDLIEKILLFAENKGNDMLNRQAGGKKRERLTGIPKLDDANLAGGAKSEQCTLILTEGDSAKSLAVSGLTVLGRDSYGVFPLRGKLLNVRDASPNQISENAEIKHITQIMGLQFNKEYHSLKGLRYGHLMIMADQDHDGSHIKGLLINYIHKFWPSLLKVPGFLIQFITPIIKGTKKSEELSFFTIPDFINWKKTNNTKGWAFKYFKGLGTSTQKDAKQYFSRLNIHRIEFKHQEGDDDLIDMAFSKKRAENRKRWIEGYQPGDSVDYSKTMSYNEFINKELILFSIADCERSIPSMVDGLKPGQRKILFSCFKRNLVSRLKVAQLAGYVAEVSAYHHGEVSLQSTIVGMAQNFVGSNNINLLYPEGSFGTRLMGGKDAAQPRYIFTRLCKITRSIFNPIDDNLLEYLNEEGLPIEPKWYMPILPLVLINGADGIGTGWSTTIPNYNPRDVVDNLLRLMNDEPLVPMSPWYRNFEGSIEANDKTFKVTGNWEKLDDVTIRVTELPIQCWTDSYKEFLESLITEKKAKFTIKDYNSYCTTNTVNFEINFPDVEEFQKIESDFEKKMKLVSSVNRSNMHAFNSEGKIQRYDSPENILTDFYHLRYEYYQKRKNYLKESLQDDCKRLDNKVRFIKMVINGEIVISNKKRAHIIQELEKKGFDKLSNSKKKKKVQMEDAIIEEQPPEEGEGGNVESLETSTENGCGYNYLLSLPMWSLTQERIEQLSQEALSKKNELDELIKTEIKELWRRDLDNFLVELDDFETELAEQQIEEDKGVKSGKGRKRGTTKKITSSAKPKPKVQAKKKKAENSDSDENDDHDVILAEGDDFENEKPNRKRKHVSTPTKQKTLSFTSVKNSSSSSSTSSTNEVPSTTKNKKTKDSEKESEKKLEDEFSVPLKDRLKMKSMNEEPKKTLKKKPPSTIDDDDEIELLDSDFEEGPSSKIKTLKQQPLNFKASSTSSSKEETKPKLKRVKKLTIEDSDSEPEILLSDEERGDDTSKKVLPKPKAKAKKKDEASKESKSLDKPKPKPKPKAKGRSKKIIDSESELESEEEDDFIVDDEESDDDVLSEESDLE